jgi:erythrocyte band 7 integral membrane protein
VLLFSAEGEHKASRALRHAADVISENPAALQLRYLQTLNNISAENNSTIVFPVPVDILSQLVLPQHQAVTPPVPVLPSAE